MSTHIDEQLDDLEAGELSVEFEGQEPWDLLEWAIDRFGGRLAISTAFQEGDVALIDMAYKIDPDVRVFSMDTGRLPQETFDLIEQLRDRYEGLRLELISPDAGQVQRLVDRHGPNLFFKSVENRLLCCNVRKVQPLTRALADLDAWVTGLRRDQWASRSDIRKVEIDHDHGAIVKLNPLAEWQEDEVWDYLRENDVPTHPLYEQGYTSIGCAPVHEAGRRRASPCGQAAGGGRRTPRRSAACTARSRPAASSTSCTRSSARARMPDAAVAAGDQGVGGRARSSRSPRRGPCSRPLRPRSTARSCSSSRRRSRTGSLDDRARADARADPRARAPGGPDPRRSTGRPARPRLCASTASCRAGLRCSRAPAR